MTKPLFDLSGQTAIVTGTSRGVMPRMAAVARATSAQEPWPVLTQW